jgi:hypothetical protein
MHDAWRLELQVARKDGLPAADRCSCYLHHEARSLRSAALLWHINHHLDRVKLPCNKTQAQSIHTMHPDTA